MTLTHDDYTVAWICALSLEMAAAISMLDEVHTKLSQPATDNNSYTLGRLGVHNVAIACLPSGVYGTISAARVLSDMLSTFHSLQFGLMVGIGGGVPSESTDIRLGDVVVSNPTKALGGVIQYDYGKACDGTFERIGSLNKPPQILLTSVSQIRSNYMLGKGRVQENISKALRKSEIIGTNFSRPCRDLLFSSAYNHKSGNLDCSKCDENQLVNRAPRTKEPQIHYGVIASGNTVIKDAKQRDSIAQDSGILCFEMEAAGLMDQLPCLVIRGISDYCDSHKAQDWQRYAALSAASYTRELLGIVPSSRDRHMDISMQCQKAPSQHSSPATITQKSSHHPILTTHSGITTNPKGITDYIDTPVVKRVNDFPKQSSAVKTCNQACSCNCHKRHLVKSPPFMRPVMGTFFLRYQGASFFRSSCDEETCRKNNSGSLEAIYCFPGWLIDITFVLSGSPSYGLNFPRRLGWGSSETILKSAYEGNVEGLKVLLSSSSYALHDIDQKHGRSALHYAVMRNHIEACEFLCNASANAHAMDYTGITPTIKAWEHILTQRGTPAQLVSLKRLFCNIDLCDDMGFSHIHLLVVERISGDLVEHLRNRTHRDQINTPDFTGKTPLHWAAIRGDFQKIQILLQSRADVTAVDGSGSTPLMLAASSGCSKSLELLLEAGSNVHFKNSYGSDALYHACRHQSELAPVIRLLQSGACVNSQNKNGHTALIGAAIRNNTKIGKYLLRKGATIDTRGAGGETALFEAIFHNSHRFLRLLFQWSANYTIASNSGSTILHSAALEGDCETLTIMLHTDLGQLDISHRNKDHITAAEMVQRRSIVSEEFELKFSELLSSVKARQN